MCAGMAARHVIAGGEEGMAVPVSHRAIAAARHADRLYQVIAVTMEFAHLVAVDHIDRGVLGRLQQKMTTRTGLIGQQSWAAGADVGVGIANALLLMRREIVADGERRAVQLQNGVAVVAASGSGVKCAIPGWNINVAFGIGGPS